MAVPLQGPGEDVVGTPLLTDIASNGSPLSVSQVNIRIQGEGLAAEAVSQDIDRIGKCTEVVFRVDLIDALAVGSQCGYTAHAVDRGGMDGIATVALRIRVVGVGCAQGSDLRLQICGRLA